MADSANGPLQSVPHEVLNEATRWVRPLPSQWDRFVLCTLSPQTTKRYRLAWRHTASREETGGA